MEILIDNLCSTFVGRICNGRDAHHGFEHMKEVKELSMKILDEMKITDLNTRVYVLITAWLHDVNDSKFKSAENQKAMKKFLESLRKVADFPLRHSFVVEILFLLPYISFSMQMELFQSEVAQFEVILPEHLVFVRNVVSDADKYYALGQTGLQRCLEYSKYKYPNEDSTFHEKHFVKHYEEKLGLLLEHFISTKVGYKHALPQHLFLYAEYKKYLKKYHLEFLKDKLANRPNAHLHLLVSDVKEFATCQEIQGQIYICRYPNGKVQCQTLEDLLKEDLLIRVL